MSKPAVVLSAPALGVSLAAHVALISTFMGLGGEPAPPQRSLAVALEWTRDLDASAEMEPALPEDWFRVEAAEPEPPPFATPDILVDVDFEPPPDLDDLETLRWMPRDRRRVPWLTRIATRVREPEPMKPDDPDEVARPSSERTTALTPLVGWNKPPRYPRSAVRRGQQGRVLLEVHVDAGGIVVSCVVVQSSGHHVLDRAARRAVAGWRFHNGPGVTRVPVRFVLRPASCRASADGRARPPPGRYG